MVGEFSGFDEPEEKSLYILLTRSVNLTLKHIINLAVEGLRYVIYCLSFSGSLSYQRDVPHNALLLTNHGHCTLK